MKSYLIIICLFSSLILNAQRGNILPGNNCAGGADVANTESWQAFSNPATAAIHNKYIISAAYENKYITKELSNKTISALFPTKYFNITAAFNHFGYSAYNEMLVGLGLARNFGSWKLGVEVDAFMLYISPTENYKYTVTAQIGAQVDVAKNLTLGFSIFNPVFSYIKTNNPTYIPVRISAAINYKIHKSIHWLTQIDADIRSKVYWRTGFHYKPFKQFIVKVGAYGHNYIVPTLGLGLDLHLFKFNLHCEIDPRIGVNLSGELRFQF